jgi:D-3-phosphoglycerate dehydrogenase / 2-oxoglutarate reductase
VEVYVGKGVAHPPARIVVTDHVFASLDLERSILEPLGAELVLAPASDEATLSVLAEQATGIIVCYARITQSIIGAAARGGCRIIARYGIGYDNIDVAAATEAGILVTYVPDYCLDEVADHTIGLLLATGRGIMTAASDVRTGGWTVPRASVHRLQGRQLTLLGTGRIGRRVAARALAFGLELVGYDPFVAKWDLDGVRRATTLEQALGDADFVSLHAPMTPANRHLVSARTLAMMHRSPILINTARGGLVDLDSVVAALDDGRLGGVALDVAEVEPLPVGHPLRRHPRALITPHMAFFSIEAQDDLQRRTADEVARALTGLPPRCPVNPEVLSSSGSRSA